MESLRKPGPRETTGKPDRKPYPSDVSDDEWAFVAPYLTLMTPDAPQRCYDLRETFNALRWIVRAGAPWRYLPNDFPPWKAVYDQTQRWIEARVFEDIVDDLREVLRVALGKRPTPSAAILDSQTLRSTPESGARAGYDAGKRVKGTKVHAAVDTLGNLLSLVVTPANEQDRDLAGHLVEDVQAVTGDCVQIAFADGAYTGAATAQAAQAHGVTLEIVKLPDAVRGFVLLPKRWIVERSFAWKSRFRRLVRDYERLPETVAGLHIAVFAILMLARWVATTVQSA
jgi:transposase